MRIPVLPRRRDLQIGERDPLSAADCARILCTGIVGVSGPRYDVVIEPVGWQQHIALAGDGDAERSFELAADLKARLTEAVLRVLTEFGERQAAA